MKAVTRLWVLVAALTLAACDWGETDERGEWRIALEEIEGSIQHRYAERFAEEIEQRTDGEIQVTIYPYGAVGTIEDLYEQLQDGAIQMGFGSGLLGGTVPESQLFNLHFVFSDDEYVNARALNDPEFLRGDDLQAAYRERDLVLLSLVPEGWQVWSANRLITDPEDFRGVGIRVMDSRLHRATYRAYGADPTAIEYGELYGALETGLVDAAEQPYFAHEEMGFHEVQDYLIAPRASQFVASFMASRRFYDRISEERQEMLRQIAEDLVDEAHELQQRINRQARERMLEAGGTRHRELDEEEREEFRDLARPVRAVYGSEGGRRGEPLLAQLLDAIERARETIQAEEEADND